MMLLFNQRLGGPSLQTTPNLMAWFAELSRRPVFRAVRDEIRQADLQLSRPVDGAYPDRV